jgi:hypothetical protein
VVFCIICEPCWAEINDEKTDEEIDTVERVVEEYKE